MSIIKSLSVGNGDMFYIKHGSSNFTIIDCNMDDTNREMITDEIIEYINYAKAKGCSMQGTEDPYIEKLNVLK